MHTRTPEMPDKIKFLNEPKKTQLTNQDDWAISELPFAYVSKRVYVWNHSYENVFCLERFIFK